MKKLQSPKKGMVVGNIELGAGFEDDGEYDDYLEYLKGSILEDEEGKGKGGLWASVGNGNWTVKMARWWRCDLKIIRKHLQVQQQLAFELLWSQTVWDIVNGAEEAPSQVYFNYQKLFNNWRGNGV